MRSPYLLQAVALVCLSCAVSRTAFAETTTGSVWNAAANRWVDVTFGDGYKVLKVDNITVGGDRVLKNRDEILKGGSVNGQPVTLSAPATTPTVINRVNGRVVLSTPSAITVGGKTVPVLHSIKAGAMATGRLAVALAKVAGPVGVAVAAYDLFSTVKDFSVTYKSPGVLDINKVGKTLNCPSGSSGIGVSCLSYVKVCGGGYGTADQMLDGCDPAHLPIKHLRDDGPFPYYYVTDWTGYPFPQLFLPIVLAPVVGAQMKPATEQELIAAIDSETGIPNGVVADTIKAGLETGVDLETDDTTEEITGPATVPGTTTTTNNPDGTTTTNTTTNHLTYQGDKITHNVTNEVKTCTGAGSCSTAISTTTNTPPVVDKPKEDVTVTDSPFGPVPTLYTPKYPDGLTGVWSTKKAELNGSSLAGLTAVLLPPMAESGGVCPVWMLDLSLASWANFGQVNVAPPCWIWAFAKTVIVISALLLARALVFGG